MARSRIVNIDMLQQFTAVNFMSDPGEIGGPVVIPNCTQVVLNWTLADGKSAHNVMYGRSAGVPNPTVAMADAIFAALGTGAQAVALLASIATTCAMSGVTLRSVHTANLPMIASTAAAKPGTDATIALPNEVAAVVTLRTALTGPQNRGRLFIPGFASDTIGVGNVISPATVTALQNWANTIIAALSGQALTLVIGQRARQAYTGITGTAHPERQAGSQVVTSTPVRDNHWDTVRRRGLR
jgi:hypothetical protein